MYLNYSTSKLFTKKIKYKKIDIFVNEFNDKKSRYKFYAKKVIM